ncbi:hypothetical protein DI396_08775 [Litorivita pollutaquae]|uniref:Uncharacterized protein n=1 Tax=Litorivita pollutaquae TaxID=2200892 RepID=A0A2V4MLJ4_9RHOB|nr:hypothetical protein [Litorivita pollutaquae]PYC47535.1 hypothetical protein DI396_08775 [Litorivita pollutaquae]
MPQPRRPEVSAFLLILICLSAAAAQIAAPPFTAAIAGPALLLFFLREWRHLARMARILVMISLLGSGMLLLAEKIDLAVLGRAIDRAAFLAFFVTALSLLQSAGGRSPMIRNCGEALVEQPPGRRYTVLTIGGALFGVLLSLGTLSLLGSIIVSGVEGRRGSTEPRISEIRMQRMTLAMLRGFSTIPMWSPTTMTLAIILSGLPSLRWIDILPLGLAATVAFLVLGWITDRLTYPRPSGANRTEGAPLTTLLPLVGLVILIPGVAYVVAEVLGLSMIAALLVTVPFISFGWIFIQMRGAGDSHPMRASGTWIMRDVLPSLPSLRSEVGIFAGSAFIGILIPPLLNLDVIGSTVAQLGLSAGGVLVLSFWGIALALMVGINPIISATIAIEILPNLPGLALSELGIAHMVMMSWAVIIGLSPFSTSVRMSARVIGREAAEIGLRWNLRFSLVAGALLSLYLFFIGA